MSSLLHDEACCKEKDMKKLSKFWQDLSIRFKLLVYFFVIIFFVSLFNVYLNNNNYSMMDQFDETMTNYYRINELLNQTRANQNHMDRYLRELDEAQLDLFYESEESMAIILTELYDQFSSREAYFILNAIDNSVQSYMPRWHQSIKERQENISTYYEPYYDGQRIYRFTEGYVQDLLYLSLSEGRSLYNKLAEESALMRQISLMLIIGVFALALIFGALFSNYLVRPIKKLAAASRQMASGDLAVEAVELRRQDEIGSLADSFNTMSASIHDYVKDLEQKVVIEKKLHQEELAIIKMEQLLRESEFQALQSQINPHFLFNTLNTISRTAMFEEADDTVKLIQALSNLFRYRIKNSGDTVSLEEELSLINEYIYLQKMRFKDRLNFELNCVGDMSGLMIPVFTIQPLVENAIIHGIEPKIDGGKVRIKVRSNDYRTVINITDTGVGIEADRLKELVEKSRLKSSERIGIANVYNRFMLHFEKRGHFSIFSRTGIGTVIKLVIEKEGLEDV